MQREVSSKIMSGICANRSSNDGKELNKTSKNSREKIMEEGEKEAGMIWKLSLVLPVVHEPVVCQLRTAYSL